MLVLLVILGLSTKQVDYTAAFLHAPINTDPDWDNLSPKQGAVFLLICRVALLKEKF
jgi:hypothetical protein